VLTKCCNDICVVAVIVITGLCDEIVQLFDASSTIDDNCKAVVSWAENMHVRY
jgi:hypothetical protein